jgi:cardiolipin synthase (CMP-forming)
MNGKRENIWNVPNALTMIRVALIPVFLLLYYSSQPFWALSVFLIASATDLLDGYIARKYNLITDFGKLMDPLADKLMVISVLLVQTISGILPPVAVIIVILKELIMVLGGAYMLKRGIVVYSEVVGKAAQFLFIVALSLSFFHQDFLDSGAPAWDMLAVWVSVGLTLLALAFYTRNALEKLRAVKKK